MPTAAVAGTGLIGTSIALGLAAEGWQVAGWDPDPGALATAAAMGAVSPTGDLETLVATGPDLLVLAAPPAGVVELLPRLAGDFLVTDVAGVKAPVVAAARHLPRFVPGHPMAGREVSGPAAASASLFRGAAWVLVDEGPPPDAVTAIEEIVATLGARPVRMSAAAHDAAVAMISHLPQVLAVALLREAAESVEALDLVAGSFRDLTRVAASDPAIWADLLAANGPEVSAVVTRFATRLRRWADAIAAGNDTEIRSALAAAADLRRSMVPATVAVQVALADRPGEIARVGHALEASRVDVRDLQLRHSPHGGGGLLSIFVRPAEAVALRIALEKEGLILAG